MKTIIEFFEELPPFWRESALKQCDEFRRDKVVSGISWAILQGLQWDDTKEGEENWDCLYNWYTHGCSGEPPEYPRRLLVEKSYIVIENLDYPPLSGTEDWHGPFTKEEAEKFFLESTGEVKTIVNLKDWIKHEIKK